MPNFTALLSHGTDIMSQYKNLSGEVVLYFRMSVSCSVTIMSLQGVLTAEKFENVGLDGRGESEIQDICVLV